jgi:hypothetical protein
MNVAQQLQPLLLKQDQQSQNISSIPNEMPTKEIQSETKKKKKRKKKKTTNNKEMEVVRNTDTKPAGQYQIYSNFKLDLADSLT